MAQRVKTCHNNLNSDVILCEKYISRILSKDKPNTVQKGRDKNARQPNQNQMSKMKPNVKQQNVPSPKHSQVPNNLFQYHDDTVLTEIPMKTTNTRQRSRSTGVDRGGTWGQLLKQQKSGDRMSVFGNFDPLRTLHFLAKELQHQLEVLLPEETTVQQVVTDIQYALKRVPPDVASTVHLQQAYDLLPRSKDNVNSDFEKPEKLRPIVCEKSTQTPPATDAEEQEKLHKMLQSTLKFEESCKQMENLCMELKKEKDYLVKQLDIERENVTQLRIRTHDLEIENNNILIPRIKALEEEKRKLEANFAETAKNLESEALATTSDLKAQLAEAKKSKMLVDQECVKLKHQLKLSGLEREKFVAILSVRDKQINEIRNEMTQLQEVVNEQLLELHNSAFKSKMGGNHDANPYMNGQYDKENIGDTTISTIYSKDEDVQRHFHVPKSNHSFRALPAGDLDYSSVLPEYQETDVVRNGGFARKDQFFGRSESQASIRNLFSEAKKTAYSVASTPKEGSQYNLHTNS